MILEHLVVAESKKALKRRNPALMGYDMSEGHRSQLKELPMAKAGII